MDTTINLLGELGVTNRRWLKKAPALTLRSDGTIIVWSKWAHAQEDGAALKAGKNPFRYYGWLASQKTFDLKAVRKVRYIEDLNIFIRGGLDLSTFDSGVQFFRALHRDTTLYFSIDPLWLALPQVRQFLTTHITGNIRNDFDPTRNWLLRQRYFDSSQRFLKETSQVIGQYGAITWEHEDGTAQVKVFGSTRAYLQKPQRWLLEPSGVLVPSK